MATASAILTGDAVLFDRDLHAYIDDGGARRMSVTQAIKVAGLIDYSMVPADVLAAASERGQLVHQATALIDLGESLDEYEIPEVAHPYIDAYLKFQREMRFVPDPEWVERPMIVELFGHRIGMTPDVVGEIDGVPSVIERKATASSHPAWQLQTAGYSMGLQAAGIQIRQRFALQLLKTGRYRLFPHEERGDFDTFTACYQLAAWKVKNRLAQLD